MAVLKAQEFARNGEKRQVFNFSDIAAEAEAIIADARRQGRKILDEAQADLQQRFEQARKDGYQKGYQEGLEKGQEEGARQALKEASEKFQQESEATLTALKELFERFDQAKDKILWLAEQDTVELALEIAARIVKDLAEINREVAADTIREALALVNSNTNVTVRVNPEDWNHLEKMVDNAFPGYRSIKFQPDESITPGGCIVETPNGKIDALVETQLQRIARQLLAADKDEILSDGKVKLSIR